MDTTLNPPADACLRAGTPAFLRANVALALAGFTCFALSYGTQPVLPQLTQEFQISPATASLSVSAGTAAMAILLIPLSLMADRYGRERLMRWGLIGAALFALASALAPNFAVLLLCRAGLGACIAGVPAAAMAYLGEEIAPESRGGAMGVYIGANALGGMSGRLLSGLVTDWMSWRHGLMTLALVGTLSAYLFWRLLPPAKRFVPRSLRLEILVTDVRGIYRDPALPWLFLTAFLIMGAFVGLYNYLGFRLSLPPYSMGPGAIGAMFLLYTVGSFSSAWAGHACARIGQRRLVLMMSLSMTLGIAITLASPLVLIIMGLAIFTFGYFSVHTVASSWVGKRAGARRSLVSALYLSSYYLGGSVIGTATGWPWVHHGWDGVVWTLLICIGLVIIITTLSLRRQADD